MNNHFLKKFIPRFVQSLYRYKREVNAQAKLACYWNPIINDYFNGKVNKWNLAPKQDFKKENVIWQYWGQGVEGWEKLPEVVRICFESVDKYSEGYRVIRLSDETISDYIDLPDFVYDKLSHNPEFTRTFFSDLLRVSLLSTYGGVWLDATILLTGRLPEEYAAMDYFMYQRSDDEPHKAYWMGVYAPYFGWHKDFKVRVLNSIIFAKRGSAMMSALQDLLLYYWEHEEHIRHYFFFQILYNELVEGSLASIRCPIVNDCIPHIIQTKINGGRYPYHTYEDAMKMTNIHKMSYYNEESMQILKSIIAEDK